LLPTRRGVRDRQLGASVTTKYMAPDRREAVFERIVHLRGRALDAKLAALLLEMLLRARQEQLAVDADISKMEGMLRTALMQQAQQVQVRRSLELHGLDPSRGRWHQHAACKHIDTHLAYRL
jgi:hypothetical protein